MRALTLSLSLALLGAVAARGQSVHWEPPGGSLPVGQTTPVNLVFDDCEAKEPPAPPKVGGLTLQYVGQSTTMAFDNGSYTHSVNYTYAALLGANQTVVIPEFTVETSKGPLTVRSVRFDPTTATVGANGRALDTAVSARLEPRSAAVWAGEVFGLDYEIEAASDYHPDFGHGVFEWTPDPLIVEEWSQPEPFQLSAGSESRTGLAYHTRAIAAKAGRVQLSAAKQLVNLSVGVTGFGFFQQRQYEQFSVPSSAPAITVRPLPAPPPNFTGAVGTFKLTSKVVPEKAGVGDPVTWTLELTGTGNWPAIEGLPPREVSQDFQVIHPQTKKVPAAGKTFDATLTEDAVLIPTRPGTYPLPPVRFVYFDPKLGAYQTLTTPEATVTIAAPLTPEAPAAGAPAASAAPGASAPPLPAGIPRDPVPGPGSAAAPLSPLVWAGLLLAPLVALIGGWFCLARQLALRSDPRRRQREAHHRLEMDLGGLRGVPAADASGLRPLLHAWQRDAAELWALAQAAPSAGAIPDPAWALLWSQADRLLYGPGGELPADWTARAERALAAKPAPVFSSRQIWLRRNWFPFLFAVLALAAEPVRARAASPEAAYARGDFAAAEQGWRQAVAADPADWTARENLSLALAQEGRWPEAAAEAAAAFVQQPQSEPVRWQWSLASETAGFVPEPLAAFISPGPMQWLARQASPAVWQRVLVAAALLAAAALGLLLRLGYGRAGGRGVQRAAYAALAAAVLLAGAALAGQRAFGVAGDPAAVVVWRSGSLRSVPTEADTDQKTSPLPAGSTATVDKRFLGWIRLSFRNGQTGWVRREDVVPLWQ
jgi:hypothetical protein